MKEFRVDLWTTLFVFIATFGNTSMSVITGEHCEVNIDECSSWPCENRAECIDGIDSYACQCMPGFEGYNCEIDIDECDSSPCDNQAVCIDEVNGYTCKCVPGFIGNSFIIVCIGMA